MEQIYRINHWATFGKAYTQSLSIPLTLIFESVLMQVLCNADHFNRSHLIHPSSDLWHSRFYWEENQDLLSQTDDKVAFIQIQVFFHCAVSLIYKIRTWQLFLKFWIVYSVTDCIIYNLDGSKHEYIKKRNLCVSGRRGKDRNGNI